MRSILSTTESTHTAQDQFVQRPVAEPHFQTNSLTLISEPAYLILALILPVFAVAPLFYPGHIQTHQGLIVLWNLADLRAHPGNLSWVPSMALHFDPLRSDGLLVYYLAALLPLSPVVAVKAVVGLSWLGGCLGMFLWLRNWSGNQGALIAALVYTYLPYQIGAVYVRGAWGETLFWGLLPWALWLLTRPDLRLKKFIPLHIFLWLLLGLSQLGLTIWALLFAILLLLAGQRSQVIFPILAGALGMIAAAVAYLLLTPRTLFVSALIPFADHFLYPSQLFSAYWGFGSSRPGWNDGLSLQLGLAAVGLAAAGVFLWLGREREPLGGIQRPLAFFLGGAILFTLLQFQPSLFFWNLPLWPGQTVSSTLTYPWQLLGLAGLCLSVWAGTSFRLAPADQFNRLPFFGATIIFIILSIYPYLLPQFISLDDYPLDQPQAELGEAQLTLLAHSFLVATSGHTAGLEQGETTLPLAVYGPLQANDTLVVTTAWQPLRPFHNDLKVFVHLVDAKDNILAQFDGQPLQGKYSTSQWTPGEIIEDAYPVIFPADAPPGPYRVFIGFYDEPTLQRLSVPTDPAGRVILNVQ